MKGGVLVFVLLMVGFFGMEMYAAKRNSYRMQPDYIYAQFVGAAHAVDLCAVDTSENRVRFDRNRDYARQRAAAMLAENAGADATAQLTALEATTRDEAAALLAEKGCDDMAAWRLLKRYDLLASQNPPIPDLPTTSAQ